MRKKYEISWELFYLSPSRCLFFPLHLSLFLPHPYTSEQVALSQLAVAMVTHHSSSSLLPPKKNEKNQSSSTKNKDGVKGGEVQRMTEERKCIQSETQWKNNEWRAVRELFFLSQLPPPIFPSSPSFPSHLAPAIFMNDWSTLACERCECNRGWETDRQHRSVLILFSQLSLSGNIWTPCDNTNESPRWLAGFFERQDIVYSEWNQARKLKEKKKKRLEFCIFRLLQKLKIPPNFSHSSFHIYSQNYF